MSSMYADTPPIDEKVVYMPTIASFDYRISEMNSKISIATKNLFYNILYTDISIADAINQYYGEIVKLKVFDIIDELNTLLK